MSFPESAAISAGEPHRLAPIESDHHEDCPQHPWNNVCDDAEPCECEQLRAADAAEIGDIKNDMEKGA